MRISSRAFKQYFEAVEMLGAKAESNLKKFVAQCVVEGMDYDTMKEAVTEYSFRLVDKYGTAAGSVSAKLYDAVADSCGVKTARAEIAKGVAREQIAANVIYHAGQLYDGQGVDAFADGLSSTLKRHIRKRAGDTQRNNAVRDRKRGARFARMPDGGACDFCRMLASRGFVYASRDTAGEFDHYHDHCRCVVVANFGEDAELAGYDPSEYAQD